MNAIKDFHKIWILIHLPCNPEMIAGILFKGFKGGLSGLGVWSIHQRSSRTISSMAS